VGPGYCLRLPSVSAPRLRRRAFGVAVTHGCPSAAAAGEMTMLMGCAVAGFLRGTAGVRC
jgi:hypothetical protein